MEGMKSTEVNMRSKKLKKGTKVLIIGNSIRYGTVEGKFKNLYVIRLRKAKSFTLVCVHPDNIYESGK